VASLQTFRERPPARRLGPYVTCVWAQEVFAGSSPYRHRTVPNGSSELVCEVGGDVKVVGPQTGPTEELLAPGTTVVGVRLRPGASQAVLGLPTSELVDLVVPVEELWASAASSLSEQIAGSDALDKAAVTLERAVFARLAGEAPPDPIVAEMVRRLSSGPMSGVSSLASSLYLSERQLRRRCEAAVGLAPKALQRMLRFQRFLALAYERHHSSEHLAVLAAEAGYADQAHLTRESRRLAGHSPVALLREAQHHCCDSHDHGASYGPLLQWRARAVLRDQRVPAAEAA
jgi:AraC-like DNA-binding protein